MPSHYCMFFFSIISDVSKLPLMEGQDKSLRVLGFNRRERTEFLKILMRSCFLNNLIYLAARSDLLISFFFFFPFTKFQVLYYPRQLNNFNDSSQVWRRELWLGRVHTTSQAEDSWRDSQVCDLIALIWLTYAYCKC